MPHTDFGGGGLNTKEASPLTTTTTTTSVTRALRDCGVAAHNAERLAQSATPDLIGAWCEYQRRHRNMGPGALVNVIRYGEPPPGARRRPLFEP